jgi:hypothetical protein
MYEEDSPADCPRNTQNTRKEILPEVGVEGMKVEGSNLRKVEE